MKVKSKKDPGMSVRRSEPPNPLDYLQPQMSPHIRGQKEVAYFNSDYNDLMYALSELQGKLIKNDKVAPVQKREAEPIGEQHPRFGPKESGDYGYGAMIDYIAQKTGGNPDMFRGFVDTTRFHESGRTDDGAYQSRQITDSGEADGVGKGAYMYGVRGFGLDKNGSLTRPEDGGLHPLETAQNRYNVMAEAMGTPLIRLTPQQIMDPRTIDPRLQDALFLADKYQDENSSFKNIGTNPETWVDNWLDTHWKGDAEEREKRRNSYESHRLQLQGR